MPLTPDEMAGARDAAQDLKRAGVPAERADSETMKIVWEEKKQKDTKQT